MTRNFRSLLLPLLALAAWLCAGVAQADPPARVGRLAVVEGNVEFSAARDQSPAPASVNWPVSNGALLVSTPGSRAEIWIGSTAYRLGPDSQVEFVGIDDERVDVWLPAGTLAVSLLDASQVDDALVRTPFGDVRFAATGRYRIEVGPEQVHLSVLAGRASLAAGPNATRVGPGQQASLDRDGRLAVHALPPYDAFDAWVGERESASLAATSARYVSPAMTGYQDLDRYGDWQRSADYGMVWYPRGLAADWAPYRSGRWAWVEPWGWTWIDAAPWGFAPFHYGRWAIVMGRWAWIPGAPAARPVYAPALVAWMGRPGWSASFAFGSAPAVGWFPLGPREVYVPPYRYSPNYVTQINIMHVSDRRRIEYAQRPDFDQHYAFRDAPRAVTVVPADRLRDGRPFERHDFYRPGADELRRAPLAGSAPGDNWVRPAPRDFRPADGGPSGGRALAPRFGERGFGGDGPRNFAPNGPQSPNFGRPNEPLPGGPGRPNDGPRPLIGNPFNSPDAGRDSRRPDAMPGNMPQRPAFGDGRPNDPTPGPQRPAEPPRTNDGPRPLIGNPFNSPDTGRDARRPDAMPGNMPQRPAFGDGRPNDPTPGPQRPAEQGRPNDAPRPLIGNPFNSPDAGRDARRPDAMPGNMPQRPAFGDGRPNDPTPGPQRPAEPPRPNDAPRPLIGNPFNSPDAGREFRRPDAMPGNMLQRPAFGDSRPSDAMPAQRAPEPARPPIANPFNGPDGGREFRRPEGFAQPMQRPAEMPRPVEPPRPAFAPPARPEMPAARPIEMPRPQPQPEMRMPAMREMPRQENRDNRSGHRERDGFGR